MKGFVAIIGLLTIAQWLFIGLLYGFLQAQGKDSPDTMAKLHDFPVIGGYFPKVKLQTKVQKERKYGDDLRERLIDARRQWDLPKSYDEKQFSELLTEIRTRGDRLKTESRKLEKLKQEIHTIEEEVNNRELAVIADRETLSRRKRALDKAEDEIRLRKNGQKTKINKREMAANRKIAKWYDNMSPEKAAEKLAQAPENETRAEKVERLRQAALLLTLMDEEQAANVIDILDPVDFVEIQRARRELPVSQK